MAQRSSVPQFGKWESEEIPYTVYFEKARKNRGGRVINPNDPQENPELFQNLDAPPPNPRNRSEQREYGDNYRQSPGHRAGLPANRADHNFERSPLHPGAGTGTGTDHGFERSPVHPQQGRAVKPAVGTDQGFDRSPARPVQTRYYNFSVGDVERSPLHPQHHRAKSGGRGSASPAQETRSRDNSHGSSGKSRSRPSRGDESFDQGATVPPFGQWNGNDPQAAEQYTAIFDKIHEENNSMAGNTPKHPSYSNRSQASANANQTKRCCFPWW